MEILNQITVLVSNPPQGSGNHRRLRKGFNLATADTRGFMNFKAFSKAIRYPLKLEVQRKLYDEHFRGGFENRGLDYHQFLDVLMKLSGRPREDRIKDILNFYSDGRGNISFEDFENIIAVALQQIDFQIGEVELHRLVETILKGRRPGGYRVESVREIIRQWNSLDRRIGDILYLALFLEPKVPLNTTKHINRYPSISRPRSSASKSFFVFVVVLYFSAIALLTAAVWLHARSNPTATRNACEKRHFELWKSSLLKLNETHRVPEISSGAGTVPQLESEEYNIAKSVVTELLNFHLFLASLLTLKFVKVALCQKPLCAYLSREDVRLVLWMVGFSISVLCAVEYGLLSSRVDRRNVTSTYSTLGTFLFESRMLNHVASVTKIFMIGITLLVRVPGIRNRLVHYAFDVGEPNLNVFIATHLLQEESFLKWAVPLIVTYAVDSYRFWNIDETIQSLHAYISSTSGGLILTTSGKHLEFELGDVYFLIVNQVAVSSIVPAWIISSPSDKSSLKLLLHEGHWQTKILRQHLKRIMNGQGSWNVLKDDDDVRRESRTVKRTQGPDDGVTQKLRQRNTLILSSDSDNDPNRSDWPHATLMQVSSNLKARIKGPFKSVNFLKYSRYSSMMLLITPKSAGAVMAYLQHHSETESQQKIVLFFAATEFRRVEWFVANLVRLEIRQMERHLRHGDQDRMSCGSCRMFFRIYLTSATSGQDARIMWVQLGMAVLAEGKAHLVKNLQKSLYPDLNVVAIDKELFQDLEFVLCDVDFPYADAFLSLSENADTEIRHF
ncbi:uncharacterized protein LOC114828175 [Galendromus occidentalis]|uniref:Uncharacterized protein LOC114828175 n=1 Tax=Galendromus occidentalis TaxID=34638 RepID=A0AAJ7SE12_9ACAR|nr:uncharacterized protein LOC114828175 [Galendromus occidentalis]